MQANANTWRRGWVVSGCAVVLLLTGPGCSLWDMLMGGAPGRGAGLGPRVIDVYYYDLNTKRLFTAPSDQIPPIDTASGAGMGVRAYVFACNDCTNEQDRFVGWLEMYTPAAKAVLTAPPDADPARAAQREQQMFEVWENGQLIRGVNGDKWVAVSSPEAMAITAVIETKCPGGAPKPCLPGR